MNPLTADEIDQFEALRLAYQEAKAAQHSARAAFEAASSAYDIAGGRYAKAGRDLDLFIKRVVQADEKTVLE